MRHSLLGFTLLIVGLAFVAAGCTPPIPPETSERQASDRESQEGRAGAGTHSVASRVHEPPDLQAEKPQHPTIGGSLGGFKGKVTKIGPDWFEIGAGWDGEPDIVKKKHNEGNDKPVQIFVGGTVVAGDLQGIGNPALETYRFTDIKVGDIVSVETSVTPAGQQYAVHVLIERRPGGKIPLLPPDHFGNPSFYSARNQAEQDWEEKGIPIPKQFLNKDGRYPWTNPPYPPVAPMPREAKPAPRP